MTLDAITAIFDTRCLRSHDLASRNTRVIHTFVKIKGIGNVRGFIPFLGITPIDRFSSSRIYAHELEAPLLSAVTEISGGF